MLPSPDLHLLGLARGDADPAEPHRRELLRLRREAARARRAALWRGLLAPAPRPAPAVVPPAAPGLRLAAEAPRAAAGTPPATRRAA